MPDLEGHPLQTAIKYNPHLWSEDELRAVFVVRGRELAGIIERLRTTGPDKVPQHVLVTGYRGMGKTTLLRRIALAVADTPALASQWIALTFPEEQYTVSTLAELWMNIIDALADTLEREGAPAETLARLDGDVQALLALDIGKREAAALDLLQSWVAEQQRRIVLLIDSTDLLFAALGRTAVKGAKLVKAGPGSDSDAGATPLWRLRKTLSHFPGLFWLGASYQALETDHQYSDAFHDFFEIIELRPLSLEEMRAAMLALARTFGAGRGLVGEAAEQEMRRGLDAHPERLKSLRALTGGNPRTTVILYELFATGWQGDVHSDLKALLDLMTPLYKARMEQLSEQPRKLLAHLMEHWAPMGSGDLARAADLPATTVSGQLTRLEAEGLVEKTRLAGTRRSGYQASERFFNVWYLMRYTPRRVRQRLTWLVEFMRLWFSSDDLQRLARRNISALRLGGQQAEHLEYALALADALPDSCEERHALEWMVFSAAQRIAERSRRRLNEVLPALFDGRQTQHPLVTASGYLQRFRALDASLARCPHVSNCERQDLIDEVKASLSIDLEEKEQIAEAAAELEAEQVETLRQVLVDEAARWQRMAPDDGYQKVRAAVLSGDFFPDCPDPELAYQQIVSTFSDAPRALRFAVDLMASRHHDEWTERLFRKAIALDPKDARPWNNLGNLLKNHFDRYPEAEDAYRQAVALDPKAAMPWNNLGNLLQHHFDRYEEAKDAYRQAIALDPRDPYPLANLARLMAQRGTKGEADRLYREAAALGTELTANGRETSYVEVVLQAQLWLKNLDAAGLALGRLAAAAAADNGLALFRIQEQARECHAIGLGAMLADLIDASDYADLLRPIALALRVAHSGPKALDGIPAEIRGMAEESLADIQGRG